MGWIGSDGRVAAGSGCNFSSLRHRVACSDLGPSRLYDALHPQLVLVEEEFAASRLGKNIFDADSSQRHADAGLRERLGDCGPETADNRVVLCADHYTRMASRADNGLEDR